MVGAWPYVVQAAINLDALKPSNAPFDDPGKLLSTVFTFLIDAAALIFIVLFFIGGIMYLTSGGNEEQTGKAKRLLIDAIVGLIITLSAFAVSRFIIKRLTDPNARSDLKGVVGGTQATKKGKSSGQLPAPTATVLPGDRPGGANDTGLPIPALPVSNATSPADPFTPSPLPVSLTGLPDDVIKNAAIPANRSQLARLKVVTVVEQATDGAVTTKSPVTGALVEIYSTDGKDQKLETSQSTGSSGQAQIIISNPSTKRAYFAIANLKYASGTTSQRQIRALTYT